jgi:hypothetical protein
MASDLDQAFIINGDDLRIALGRCAYWFRDDAKREYIGTLMFPEEVAPVVLSEIAIPYEARTADVQALARVLRDYAVGIRNPVPGAVDGTAVGKVVNPETLAETLLEEMDGKPHPMPAPPDWDGGLTGIDDPELDALHAIKDALYGLDADAQRRLIRYWAARVDAAIVCGDPF